MGAKFIKGSKPNVILKRLAGICSITDDDRLQWQGYEFFDLEPALHAIIDYGERLSFDVAQKIRNTAIFLWLKSGALTEEEFKKQLNKSLSLYKSKNTVAYVVVTSISVAGGMPFKRYVLPNAVVECHKELPKKYRQRLDLLPDWERLSGSKVEAVPDGYSIVTVRVQARDESEAIDLSIDAVDFVRGLIGFSVNPGMHMSLGFGQYSQKPMNRVMLGGMHTLHLATGKLATNQFWFEQNYNPVAATVLSGEARKKAVRESRLYMQQIFSSSHNDAELLVSSVIRYARASDEVDRNTLIVKMWAALESLVAKGESNADAIPRRCSRLYSDHEYVAQLFESIRAYRNASVHRGLTESKVDSFCYQLQRTLKYMVSFYLNSYSFLDSIDEINQFLDIAVDVENVNSDIMKTRRKLFLLRRAKYFRLPAA